ncbi:MAG TPA: hypothetical protein PL040_08725 [Bacteroidales bacterium]|nr:hypothetical protein [Bacteroidales bacterium]
MMIFLKKIIYTCLITILFLMSGRDVIYSQAVPGQDENIQFLVTFGKQGETSWGDDDFSQTWFFAVPKDFKGRFYIRVFDPDAGGENDEQKGEWDSRTLFSVYGGKGVDPEVNDDSRGIQPTGQYKSGTLLASRTFGSERQYDNKYYSFGPFNPAEGDYSEKWGYIFKVIADGVSGDDGNLYRYFLSREPNADVPIEGANAFTYEYTFRMWNNTKSISHIYPFIDEGVVYVKQKNFDWDDDGTILVVSRVRKGITVPISSENDWAESRIRVEPAEINSSLDFQFHKKQEFLVRNNNVVISLENQRGDNLKFFSAPIGGVPVYDPKIGVRQIGK